MTSIPALPTASTLPITAPPILSRKSNDGDGDNDATETADAAGKQSAKPAGVNLLA